MTDFANDIQERWKAGEEADKKNREEALQDLKFAAGEQWDEQVRQYRETTTAERPFPLPCLTINTIPQFIGQVVGDRRANATSIKVLPREDGDKEIAEIRSELIRSIELQSKADRVFANTFEAMVTCAISNMRVDLDYAYEDAFDRDLFIRAIPNPLAVNWDPFSADPTGRDATYCFVTDRIHKDIYEERYGDAAGTSLESLAKETDGWVEGETVRIAEYHEIIEKPRTFALMNDGKVVDVTEMDQNDWTPFAFVGPDGPKVRQGACKYAKMTLTNGVDPLDDPFEVKLHRLPIVRVMGREVWIGDRRVRYSLTRFARDLQRLKNYNRSVVAEKLMLAPRDNYIAPADAIEGRRGDWPNTRVFNKSASSPPVPVTQANLNELMELSMAYAQDMKDVTGLHDASLGMRSNETSGVAIQRRQNEGDIATIIYHENMTAAQQEVGEICNALIPIVYDTARTIRTVGEDDGVKMIRINDPSSEKLVDLAVGKYDVAISTGPNHATQMQEAADALLQLTGHNPKLAEIAGDLLVKSLNIKDGDKIAERIKRTIPPEILGDDAEDEKPDPVAQQQKAEAMAEAAEMKALQKEAATLDVKLKTAQAAEGEAKARIAIKQAEDAEQGINKQTADAANAETQRLRAITAKDFPLPPSAVAMLTPVVTKAIMDALASPDALPLPLHAEIAEEAYDQAEDARIRAAMPPDPMNGESAGEEMQ